MHAYAISGPVRKAVYLVTVSFAAASSIGAGACVEPSFRVIVTAATFAVVYALTYVVLYRWLWRMSAIRTRIGIADLSGSWSCAQVSDDGQRHLGRAVIRQNLVTIDVRMEIESDRWRSVSAGFVLGAGTVAVVIVLSDGARFRACRLDIGERRCSGSYRDIAGGIAIGELALELID